MTEEPTPFIQLPTETLGPAGSRGHLFIVEDGLLHPEQRGQRLQDTTRRSFIVTGRLGKLPPTLERITATFTAEDGDSFFVLPPGATTMRVVTSEGEFRLLKNSRHEISLIEFSCEAASVAAARKRFFQAVTPFMDALSFAASSPAYIASVSILDEKNRCLIVDYTAPHQKALVNDHLDRVPEELVPIYALYREALNSHSDFYRFLCYYKILEGIFGEARATLYRQARQVGVSLTGVVEEMPDTSEIGGHFPEYAGRSVKEFFDNVLASQYRNALAHFKIKGEAALNVSDVEHVSHYGDIAYITGLCTRRVIESFRIQLNEFYAHLESSSASAP